MLEKLRTHCHCWSMKCGEKFLSMLSKSESAVKAKRLILSSQTMTISKVQSCGAASHVLTAYKSASFENNFRVELLQHCALRVGGTSLFIFYKMHKIKTKIS